jgi:hypothetical protein
MCRRYAIGAAPGGREAHPAAAHFPKFPQGHGDGQRNGASSEPTLAALLTTPNPLHRPLSPAVPVVYGTTDSWRRRAAPRTLPHERFPRPSPPRSSGDRAPWVVHAASASASGSFQASSWHIWSVKVRNSALSRGRGCIGGTSWPGATGAQLAGHAPPWEAKLRCGFFWVPVGDACAPSRPVRARGGGGCGWGEPGSAGHCAFRGPA